MVWILKPLHSDAFNLRQLCLGRSCTWWFTRVGILKVTETSAEPKNSSTELGMKKGDVSDNFHCAINPVVLEASRRARGHHWHNTISRGHRPGSCLKLARVPFLLNGKKTCNALRWALWQNETWQVTIISSATTVSLKVNRQKHSQKDTKNHYPSLLWEMIQSNLKQGDAKHTRKPTKFSWIWTLPV